MTYTGMFALARPAELLLPFAWSTSHIDLNLFLISVNDGRASGSADQHCSISFLHSGSHRSGIGGRRVFFKIPPTTIINKSNEVELERVAKSLKMQFFSFHCLKGRDH